MHYAVFYSKDGTIHLWPGKTKEECAEKLYAMMKDKRVHDRCLRTTVIHRAGDGGFVFGSPESLNVLGRFDKDLKKGKAGFER